MQIKDIVFALEELFLWTFEILPVLGNVPNIIFSSIIAILFLYWMRELSGHANRGEK
ncbi:MAG: hypothetical protein ACJAZH_000044 [Roseivirga sp.]|jgi:hypothetical protein